MQAALEGGSISTLDLASNEIGVATLGAIAAALRALGVRWLPAAPQAPLPTGGGRSSPPGLGLGLGLGIWARIRCTFGLLVLPPQAEEGAERG